MRALKPVKRQGTNSQQFIKRLPADIKPLLVGSTVVIPVGDDTVSLKVTESTQALRFSLRTADPREAKARNAEAHAFVEQLFEAKRTGKPIDLNHRQIMALAGEFYISKATTPDRTDNMDSSKIDLKGRAWEDIPMAEKLAAVGKLEPEHEVTILDGLSTKLRLRAAGELEDDTDNGPEIAALMRRDMPQIAERMLAVHGIPAVTASTLSQLTDAMLERYYRALASSARYAMGDYSPDPELVKIPQWEGPGAAPWTAPGSPVTLTGLVGRWSAEALSAGLSEATVELYTARFGALAEFLEHDNAAWVQPQDLVRYKDYRLTVVYPKTGKKLSSQTIRTGDLAAFRSVFGWAYENGVLPTNPALGLKVKSTKSKVKVRDRDFTDAEATVILSAANGYANFKDGTKLDMLKRWAPWLCAYSGARIGEIAQLRKEDFYHSKDPDCWVMRLTPEAGTIKTKEAREVPLHPHLIELGIVAFVRKAAKGHLFLDISEEIPFRRAWNNRKTRLSQWVREFVPDRNVPPNHGWRHSFKAKGFEVDIQEKVLDAICGHAPSSEGRKYGSVTLKTKVDALAKFPRWDV